MVVGVYLKWNTLLVILLAGITSGLTAGMSPVLILEKIGVAFTANRFMAVFILILPVIGVLERHGLRERSEMLIRRVRHATTGRILMFYMALRQVLGILGFQVDGHVTFVWPIVAPMAEASAEERLRQNGGLPDNFRERIRAMAAASENFGQSYGSLLFVASNGLLLIKSIMNHAGYVVELTAMAKYAIPSGVAAFLLCAAYFFLFDRWLFKNERS